MCTITLLGGSVPHRDLSGTLDASAPAAQRRHIETSGAHVEVADDAKVRRFSSLDSTQLAR